MSIVRVVGRSGQEALSHIAQAGIAALWCVIGAVLYLPHGNAHAADSDVIVYNCFSTEITFVHWNDPNENGDRFDFGEREFSLNLYTKGGIQSDHWTLLNFSFDETPRRPKYFEFNSRDSWSAISPDGLKFVRFREGSLAISIVDSDSDSMFTLLAKCWG